MQTSRTNFSVLPPSVYPAPVTADAPKFETTYGEGYCERLHNDVFRKSSVLPSSYSGASASASAAAPAQTASSARPQHAYSVAFGLGTTTASAARTGLAAGGPGATQPYSVTLAAKGFSGGCTAAAYGPQFTSTALSVTQPGATGVPVLGEGAAGFCGQGLGYNTASASADPRRSQYPTLRDTQNARFKVYARAYNN